MELPKPTPTPAPESRPAEGAPSVKKSLDIPNTVDRARSVIGRYQPSAEPWNAQREEYETEEMKRELRDPRGTVSLAEMYGELHAGVERMQASRIVSKINAEKRSPTPAETRSLVAAQMRASTKESLAKGLTIYMDLVEEYKKLRDVGRGASTGEDAIVMEHLAMLTQASEKRMAIARNPNATPQQKTEADRQILKLLLCTDADVPGNNKEGILPAFRVLLDVQKEQYKRIMDRYREVGKGQGIPEATERVKRADPILDRIGKKPIPKNEANAALQEDPSLNVDGKPYDYVQYQLDLRLLEGKNTALEGLRADSEENVKRLARISGMMGGYQILRAELSFMRHHIGQDAETDTAQREPLPLKDDPEIQKYREWLQMQAKGGIAAVDTHLQRVESGVLRVGIAEKAETVWNGRVRPNMTWFADRVAGVETAWVPTLPDMLGGDYLRQQMKSWILDSNAEDGSIYDAVGWPRDPKTGRPVEQLEKEDWEKIKEKQDSIEKAIRRFRERSGIDKLKVSVATAKGLIDSPVLLPEQLVDVDGKAGLPEVDADSTAFIASVRQRLQKRFGKVPIDKLTPEQVRSELTPEEMERMRGIYVQTFQTLKADWENYSKEYEVLLGDFNTIVGTHLDMERFYHEFGDAQMDIALLLLAVAAGGAVFGAVAWKGTKWVMGKAWTAGKNAVFGAPKTVEEIAQAQVEAAQAEARAAKAEAAAAKTESAAAKEEARVARAEATAAKARVEELEKVMRGSRLQVRRANAQARIQEYLGTDIGRETFGEIGTLAGRTERAQGALEKLRTMQGLDDAKYAVELGELRKGLDPALADALKGARGDHLTALQRVLDETIAAEHALRVTGARQLLGLRFELLPAQRAAIWEAHVAATMEAKMSILTKNGIFSLEQAGTLLRSGICGDVTETVAKFGTGGRGLTRMGAAAAEGGSAFGRVSTSNIRVVGGRRGPSVSPGPNAGRPLLKTEESLLAKWMSSPAARNMLFFAGAAAEAYIVYEDLLALQRAENFYKDASARMAKQLDELSGGSDPLLTKKGNVYWYGDKVSIDASALDPTTEKTAANWRLGIDSTSMLAFLASGLGWEGPPGWIALGVIVTLHSAVSAWEKNSYYEFVRRCPAWILAHLGGTTPTINQQEEHLLGDSYVDFVLDGLSTLNLKEAKDVEIRKKLFFALFLREMKTHAPSEYGVIAAQFGGPADRMQEFFEGDFQTHVLPFYATHMFVDGHRADVGMSFIDGLNTQRGYNPNSDWFMQDIEPKRLAEALRGAGKAYATHLQEKQFLQVSADAKGERDPVIRELLEARRYELGSKVVLHTRLLDVEGELAKNGGKTRTELLMARFRETLLKAGGGPDATWEDVMDSGRTTGGGPNTFRETPMKVDGKTDTIAARRFSYDRDFDVSTAGIAGTEKLGKDGAIRFSDGGVRDPETTCVPDINRAIPAIEPMMGADAYPQLRTERRQLMEQHNVVSAEHSRLRFLERYVFWRSRAELADANVAATQTDVDAKKKTVETLDAEITRFRRERPHDVPYTGNLDEATTALAKANEQLARAKEAAARSRVDFDAYRAEYGADACAAYDKETLSDIYASFRADLSMFLLDLSHCERETKRFVGTEKQLESRTTEASARAVALWARDTFQFRESNGELAEVLKDKGGRVPTLVASDTFDAEDVRAFKELLAFPVQADSHYLSREKIYAVHCQKMVEADNTVRYLVTFVYSSDPLSLGDDPEHAGNGKEPSYVQIAGIRSEGSGYLEVGLPVLGNPLVRLPEEKRSLFLREIVAQRAAQGEKKDVELLKGTSRAERMFRAGERPGVLTQIDRSTWGVRLGEGKDSRLVLLRQNATGGWETVSIATPRTTSREVSARDWADSFERLRVNNGRVGGERRISEEEKRYGEELEEKAAAEETVGAWQPASSDLLGLFNDKAKIAPLPPEVLDAVDPVPRFDNAAVEGAIRTKLDQYYRALGNPDLHLEPGNLRKITVAVGAAVEARREKFAAITTEIDVHNLIQEAIFDAQKKLGPAVMPPAVGDIFAYIH